MAEAEPGILLLDDHRVFVAANAATAEILGVSEEDLLGRRADEFMPLVARSLYPLAWQGFLVLGSASGEYAARRPDGTHRHLAYVGFANRPIRGLHFFVLEPMPGPIAKSALKPRLQAEHIQVGRDLPPEVQGRLAREAERAEWRLPVAPGAERAVLAALFTTPAAALDALDVLRRIGPLEASIASAAGASPESPLTVLAGRVPYVNIGRAISEIRDHGGRIVTNVDERWV